MTPDEVRGGPDHGQAFRSAGLTPDLVFVMLAETPIAPRSGGHAVRIFGPPTAQSRLEAGADGLVATPWSR